MLLLHRSCFICPPNPNCTHNWCLLGFVFSPSLVSWLLMMSVHLSLFFCFHMSPISLQVCAVFLFTHVLYICQIFPCHNFLESFLRTKCNSYVSLECEHKSFKFGCVSVFCGGERTFSADRR